MAHSDVAAPPFVTATLAPMGVPFYMLSGADLEIDRQRAAELGATGYLAKFPRPEVLQRITEDAQRS